MKNRIHIGRINSNANIIKLFKLPRRIEVLRIQWFMQCSNYYLVFAEWNINAKCHCWWIIKIILLGRELQKEKHQEKKKNQYLPNNRDANDHVEISKIDAVDSNAALRLLFGSIIITIIVEGKPIGFVVAHTFSLHPSGFVSSRKHHFNWLKIWSKLEKNTDHRSKRRACWKSDERRPTEEARHVRVVYKGEKIRKGPKTDDAAATKNRQQTLARWRRIFSLPFFFFPTGPFFPSFQLRVHHN